MMPLLDTKMLEVDAVGIAIKSLAVVGGAVLGGFLVGLQATLLVRVATMRKIPPKIHWCLRSLGSLVCGWILALMLFGGGGGWGVGGTGGWGWGGTGEGPGSKSAADATAKDKSPPIVDTGNPLSSPTSKLRIEVLGDETLRKLKPDGKADLALCYRIDGEEPPILRTLPQLRATIDRRLTQKPPLKEVEIALYADSPDRQVKRVLDLENWLDGKRRKAKFELIVNDKLDGAAPMRP